MKRLISCGILIAILFAACVKKVDPVDSNNATVKLEASGSKYVTGDITVNPKDSLFFSFTITSPKDMKYVGIQKNPINQVAFVVRDTLADANKNSYTVVKKLVADSANGDFTYRIVAHDRTGTYIGHKDIKVTVSTDYNFYTYRFLKVPDTVAKADACYMDAETGAVYSYSTVGANSGLIDFGVYYDTTGTASSSTTDDLRFCLYSLNAPQTQLSFYDIGSWTKNATVMRKVTTPAFNTLTSAAGLRAAATTNLATGTSNKVTQLVAGNLVYFRTSGGKAGCLQVGFVEGSSPAKNNYINVDVKIEK